MVQTDYSTCSSQCFFAVTCGGILRAALNRITVQKGISVHRLSWTLQESETISRFYCILIFIFLDSKRERQQILAGVSYIGGNKLLCYILIAGVTGGFS